MTRWDHLKLCNPKKASQDKIIFFFDKIQGSYSQVGSFQTEVHSSMKALLIQSLWKYGYNKPDYLSTNFKINNLTQNQVSDTYTLAF